MQFYLQRLLDTAVSGPLAPSTLTPVVNSASPIFEQDQLLGLTEFDGAAPAAGNTETFGSTIVPFEPPPATPPAPPGQPSVGKLAMPWREPVPEQPPPADPPSSPPVPPSIPAAPPAPSAEHVEPEPFVQPIPPRPAPPSPLEIVSVQTAPPGSPEPDPAPPATNAHLPRPAEAEAVPSRPEPRPIRPEIVPATRPAWADEADPAAGHASIEPAAFTQLRPPSLEPRPLPEPPPAPAASPAPMPRVPGITIGHLAVEILPDRKPEPARPLTAASASVIGPLGRARTDRRLFALRRL